MDKVFDLLIAGGLVVNGEGVRRVDIGVKGEEIDAIEPDLSNLKAQERIDASGKVILPGVIDVHVHPVYLDNVADCTRVAAYGGTTTLLFYAYARPGDSLREKVEAMLEDGLSNALLDFGLHGGLFEASRQIAEIPSVCEMGVRTYKFFMPYIKQGWYTDDYHLLKAMDLFAELGGMALVHCENGGGIDYLEDKYLTGPNASVEFFTATRPAALEEEAVFRALRMAEVAHCPLYVAHMTAGRALKHIRQAQTEGQVVFAETCPQYLTLTHEILNELGALAKIGPPIRTKEDQEALWDGLADGILQVVASDHAPKTKDIHGNFLEQPFGSPQIETLLPLVYDGGVNRGRISLVRLVQVLCENPARIFGLYPQKGTIAVGSDADLVIFDPKRDFTIQAENQHSNANYTLYEGRSLLGWPEMTFQRGRRVLWEGEVVVQPGKARFLPTLKNQFDPLTV